MPRTPNAADEIKQLYFGATQTTIALDLERAIALLISLESDEARERVAVYMDGLSQMRSEWGVTPASAPAVAPAVRPSRATRLRRPARVGPAARGESPASHRDARGARPARRDD